LQTSTFVRLKWYEARRLKKSFRGSNFVQKFGPFLKKTASLSLVKKLRPIILLGEIAPMLWQQIHERKKKYKKVR